MLDQNDYERECELRDEQSNLNRQSTQQLMGGEEGGSKKKISIEDFSILKVWRLPSVDGDNPLGSWERRLREGYARSAQG